MSFLSVRAAPRGAFASWYPRGEIWLDSLMNCCRSLRNPSGFSRLNPTTSPTSRRSDFATQEECLRRFLRGTSLGRFRLPQARRNFRVHHIFGIVVVHDHDKPRRRIPAQQINKLSRSRRQVFPEHLIELVFKSNRHVRVPMRFGAAAQDSQMPRLSISAFDLVWNQGSQLESKLFAFLGVVYPRDDLDGEAGQNLSGTDSGKETHGSLREQQRSGHADYRGHREQYAGSA